MNLFVSIDHTYFLYAAFLSHLHLVCGFISTATPHDSDHDEAKGHDEHLYRRGR